MEKRTASFAGKSFSFLAYSPDEIARIPGWDSLAPEARNAPNAAAASAGTFEDEHDVRLRHWHFQPGDVVLDVGPAFGSYTFTAAIQGATVWALEPCRFCAEVLNANAEVNPDLRRSIVLVENGVHERHGWYDPDADAWHPSRLSPSFLLVSPLDSLMRSADRVDMIKLDVEGAEAAALKGAEETLRRFKPRLLIEEHEFRRPGVGAECESILKRLGYPAPEARVKHHGVFHSYYGRPA
jgi:FkbM family methyltransferase